VIIRSTALAALLGLSLFSTQAAAANTTYVLGAPCTTAGETHISSDQTDILACLEQNKNKGVRGNLFWKNMGGDSVPTIECTSGEILANPLRVSVSRGGDPNALTGFGDAAAWGGRCLNDYVLTGCSTVSPSWPKTKTGTFRDVSNKPITITYLDHQTPPPNDYDLSAWMDSSNQSCWSGDTSWQAQHLVAISCCHLVSK
jgi:hypothetical protein